MVEERPGLDGLRERGGMTWVDEARAWMARPDDVVDALVHQGFQECKREATRIPRDGHPTGGVWQGLDARTGSVASAVWVRRGDRDLVFIDIDGEGVTGGSRAGRARIRRRRRPTSGGVRACPPRRPR